MMQRQAASDLLFRHLFPVDVVAAVAPLVDTVRARRAIMLDAWRRMCASGLGANRVPTERLLQEVYVPGLRRAIEALTRTDGPAFLSHASALGETLAGVDVPFAAVVAHLNFFKAGAVQALAGEPAQMNATHLLLDRVIACLLAAIAEGYFARLGPYAGAPPVAVERAGGTPGFHGIVGRSPAMRVLYDQIARVAGATTPVLVLGETGTGKELVARAIHHAGPRRGGPFVALNCAALPRELVESELFGYSRGAFSGAVTACRGLFRSASGGTLLLDEITEMSPELQAKLLRALQERAVRPVGAVREEPVDVRVIASSNRDPEQALTSGVLRSDLYYRLSVSTLVLPPLRQRREDVVPLVEHCLERLHGRGGQDVAPRRDMTPEAMARLGAHSWPGNVRELFNVVENAFTMSPSPAIGPEDLRLAGGATSLEAIMPATPGTFADSERLLIARALAFTGGNKLRAARQLGISRKKLYAKMAKYALPALALTVLAR